MSPSPNRRQVLCGLAVALAAPGAVGVLSSCASPGSAQSAADGVPLSEVPVGGGVILEGGPDPVLVVQPVEGQVRAYNASCPHAGTTVQPPSDGQIVCPNHFSRFDVGTGAVLQGPATTGLAEVPVTVADGVVRLA